jgi:hypothetical protein
MSLHAGDVIHMQFTRIFQTPVSIVKVSGQTISLGYLYHTQLFFPVILFVFSLLGLLMESRPEASFNLGLVNAVLLIINFMFL